MENPIQTDFKNQRIYFSSDWSLSHISHYQDLLKHIQWPDQGEFILDGSQINYMDTAGAWLIDKFLSFAKSHGLNLTLENFSKEHQTLLNIVEKEIEEEKPPILPEKKDILERIGIHTIKGFDEFRDFLGFIGQLTMEFLRILPRPQKYRLNGFAGTVQKTGLDALPIIGLLSFMIGVVLAYQLGVQLRNYGANVFIVDLMGLAVLREFGPLITAIMIAGRTGSSFTAQLGIMKINQEVDALHTLGITPAEILILPRILGLVVALPLLTIWADVFGIFGGMVMSKNMLHITYIEFLHRFQHEIPLKSLIIGLGKAPIFALVIASVACYEGMRVQGSAESIGKNTTRSVVLGIFFIIVIDAAFSVILSRWKI